MLFLLLESDVDKKNLKLKEFFALRTEKHTKSWNNDYYLQSKEQKVPVL